MERIRAAKTVLDWVKGIPQGAILFGDSYTVRLLVAGAGAVCRDHQIYRAIQFLPEFKRLLDKAHTLEIHAQNVEAMTKQRMAQVGKKRADVLEAFLDKQQTRVERLRSLSTRLIARVDRAVTSGHLNGVRRNRSAAIIADVGHDFWRMRNEMNDLRKTVSQALHRAQKDRSRIEARLNRYQQV